MKRTEDKVRPARPASYQPEPITRQFAAAGMNLILMKKFVEPANTSSRPL